MTDLLRALINPGEGAIPEVVGALRALHEGRAPAPRFAPPGLPASPLLQSLGLAGNQLARLLNPANLTGAAPALDPLGAYAGLRQHVEDLERRTRERAAAVDRGLGREPGSPAPYQETLYLQSVRGGRTAGRFRCLNRRAQPTSVTAVLRPFTSAGRPATAAPSLTVRPGSFTLEPEAAAIVTVEVDLSTCSTLEAGPLQTSLDLLMDGAASVKVWIELDIYE